MKRLSILISCASVLIASVSEAPFAQTKQSDCPTAILVDIARASSVCVRLEPGQACIGNGSVTATGFDGATFMTKAGDRANISAIETITVESSEDEMGIVSISLPGFRHPWGALTLIAFGDISLRNRVLWFPEVHALATATANIRSRPQEDAEIIGQVNANDGLVLNGRNRFGSWVRVRIPGELNTGWVSVDVLNIQGGVMSLDVVDPYMGVLDSFRSLDTIRGEADLCEGSLPNGFLLQSGNNEQGATVQYDTYWIEVRGSAFVGNTDVDSPLVLYVLDGYALVYSVPENYVFVPAGAMAGAYGYINVFDPVLLAALPLQLLPVPIHLPEAITEADIECLTAEYERVLEAADATPVPAPTLDPTICQHVTRREAEPRPDSFHEAIKRQSYDFSVGCAAGIQRC